MPADYSSTAQALSLPTSTLSPSPTSSSPSSSPSSSSSPAQSPISRSSSSSPFRPSQTSHRQNGSSNNVLVPPWARSSAAAASAGPTSSINSRRLSNPYSRVPRRQAFGKRAVAWSLGALNQTVRLANSMSAAQQALAALAGAAGITLLVLFLVYSHRIFAWLAPVAEGWRALPGGWLIVFLMTCAAGFPPMIGYSTCLTVSGFVYGFPGGWPVVAAGTVAGSTASFLASRTVLSGYVHRLVGSDKRFLALGQVLRHDGLWVLVGLRFCPLPFSLSNGFLATIPSVSPWGFALATALASPKLLVHVFIGSRLARLAESGDEMTIGDKAVNYLGVLLGVAVGMAVGVAVYRRTMQRAEQLAREDLEEAGALADSPTAGNGGGHALLSGSGGGAVYGDIEEGIFGGGGVGVGVGVGGSAQFDDEDDQAAIMSEDDISLWAQEGVVVAEDGNSVDVRYRDEVEVEDGQRQDSGNRN